MGWGRPGQERMPQKPPKKPSQPGSEAERREARLAEALRANLKRRKAVGRNAGDKPSEKAGPDKE